MMKPIHPFWLHFSLLAFAPVLLAASLSVDKPNVLFILVDDLGYGDFSCYGQTAVATPHVDRLAAEGLRLNQFYVAAPICSASRVAFTTGQYPHRWKIDDHLATRERQTRSRQANWLDEAAPAVARLFQRAGYATAQIGKWHLGGGRDVGDAPLPTAYGFDESYVCFEGLGNRLLSRNTETELNLASSRLGRGRIDWTDKHDKTRLYVDQVLRFFQQHAAEPCYVHLWLNDVHDPHVPAPDTAAQFAAVTSNPQEQRFFAVLQEMDRQLGRLVAGLKQAGVYERTLVILTSDNGPTAWPKTYENGGTPAGQTGGLRGRKWSLYEGGIRMPFIARLPGLIPAGAIDRSSVVCAIDYLPTVCALAQVDRSSLPSIDGEDRSQVLRGFPADRQRPLFWEYGREPFFLRPFLKRDQSPVLAMRDGPWKLLMNLDGSAPELYHLQQDPAESNNCSPTQPQRSAEMQRQLDAWWRSMPLALTLKPGKGE